MTTLHDLLAGYEQDRQGERPTGALTASGINHPCRRQQAYNLQGVEPSDDVEPVTAATVGTMLHEAYADMWRRLDPHARVEERGDHGQADVIRERSDGIAQVRDLKTKSGKGFQRWLDQGVDSDVWHQLRIYAHDAGLPDDSQLIVDCLDRESGRVATFVENYLVMDGERAVDELHEIEDALRLNPPHLIETERTGIDDWFCDRCPWGTACLGDRETPPQVVRDYDETEVTAAAEDYLLGQKLERDGQRLKRSAKPILSKVQGDVGGYRIELVERHVGEQQGDAYSYSYPSVKRIGG